MTKGTTGILVLGILFFGSLWGLSEASLGDWLYAHDIPNSSILLGAIAFIIIAAARVFLGLRWTGALIGLIAMLFKLVNMPFYSCHLMAIFLLGTGYDIAALLVSRLPVTRFALPLTGFFGMYIGRALFAFTITYIVRYQHWVNAGLPKIISHIFIAGTIAALVGFIAAPIGNRIALRLGSLSWPRLHPRAFTGSVLGATIGIWVFQRVAGL